MSGIGPLAVCADGLTQAEAQRASRHLSLPGFGREAQLRLKAARVLVIGAGGLGSPVLLYLAAAGVGTIGIVDDDTVEVTNLQRQVIHSSADLGRPKAASAAEKIANLNPHVRVETHIERLNPDNAAGLVAGWDIVIDGTDNFATRYVVSDACTLAGVPCVWGSILRFNGQVSVFWAGHGPTYRDLHPEPPPAGEVPSCAEGGVLGVLPGTIGSVMATEAIKLLTGIGKPLLGRVLLFDALTMTWRELGLAPDPEAVEVTTIGEPTAEASCQTVPSSASGAGESITARELSDRLEEGTVVAVDVREPWEREIAVIPGSVAVPLGQIEQRGWRALPQAAAAATYVFCCKSGVRSQQAIDILCTRADGEPPHPGLVNLAGGIDAWADAVDAQMARY